MQNNKSPDMLRGQRFIGEYEKDKPRTCNLCLYSNDGGKFTGTCPYFADLFKTAPNKEDMKTLDGKKPGNYCTDWTYGICGED